MSAWYDGFDYAVFVIFWRTALKWNGFMIIGCLLFFSSQFHYLLKFFPLILLCCVWLFFCFLFLTLISRSMCADFFILYFRLNIIRLQLFKRKDEEKKSRYSRVDRVWLYSKSVQKNRKLNVTHAHIYIYV